MNTAYYVNAENSLLGPMRATKAYRRMVIEATRCKWVELLARRVSPRRPRWAVVADRAS